MYNFDKITDRRGTASLKWDIRENVLPMWVADMDFETAPEITEAIRKRADHGVFGYSIIPDEWYGAYMGWWKDRHGLDIDKEWLIFCTGVVPALSSIVRKLTTPGERILIQTPVYNIFVNSIVNNGRFVVESPLIYEDGSYRMDLERLERELADPQTTMMFLCNPQNPGGIIWDKDTLARVGEMCAANNVLVVADEIHCDLTDPREEYIPFASVSEVCRNNSITCMSPSKAFNLAGLQSAAVMVPDPVIRHKVDRGLNTDEVAEPNAFAVAATVAAFTKGGMWLDELREYIYSNKCIVKDFLKNEIPSVRLVPSKATYLLWIDCRDVTDDSKDLAWKIRKNTGLFLSNGVQYGKNGEGFIRMNIACPKDLLKDGLDRFKKGIDMYQEGE